jgi:hypothetical protein
LLELRPLEDAMEGDAWAVLVLELSI